MHVPRIWLHQSTIKNAIYLSVNVFECSMQALNIGDTIFKSPTGEGTAILHGHLSLGEPAACSAKVISSFLSYFKTEYWSGPGNQSHDLPLCSQALS